MIEVVAHWFDVTICNVSWTNDVDGTKRTTTSSYLRTIPKDNKHNLYTLDQAIDVLWGEKASLLQFGLLIRHEISWLVFLGVFETLQDDDSSGFTGYNESLIFSTTKDNTKYTLKTNSTQKKCQILHNVHGTTNMHDECVPLVVFVFFSSSVIEWQTKYLFCMGYQKDKKSNGYYHHWDFMSSLLFCLFQVHKDCSTRRTKMRLNISAKAVHQDVFTRTWRCRGHFATFYW
jgi:hypothetical protein